MSDPAPQSAGLREAMRFDGRRLDELECAASVLLAIIFAHLLHAENVSWAAFSGYMVMRGHAAESLLRGVLRIVGTVCGAALALVTTPLAVLHWPRATAALAIVGGLTLYQALTARRAYAWLFVGLTFAMILLDKLQDPTVAIDHFAATRILEVLAGTAACVAVSTLSTVTLRRRWPATRAAPAKGLGWHPHAFRHSLQAAAALALLPPLHALLHVRELSQSAVTIMAVMLVPASSLGADNLPAVSRRLLYRVIGCLGGAALAAAVLFLIHGVAEGSSVILIAGALIGVVIGRHIENGRSPRAYVGVQFTLAVLVTLVPDSLDRAALTPALQRLAGILIGMALLEPVLIAWRLGRGGRVVKPETEAHDSGSE
jgi:uncharacterized membrane protein YccC